MHTCADACLRTPLLPRVSDLTLRCSCLWCWRHRARYLPRTLQTYFAQIQPIDASTAEDGVFVGNILVDVTEAAKKAERASAVQTFVERTAILRESGVASLDALLTASLGESGHDVLPQAVATDPPGSAHGGSGNSDGPWVRCHHTRQCFTVRCG